MAAKNVGYEAVAGYQISDSATTGSGASTVQYNGYVDKEGNWYIQKVSGDLSSSATMRYIRGGDINLSSADYQTNWTGRAALTYVYFSEVF
jgi:hypothetical protein